MNIDYKTATEKDLFILRLNGDEPVFDDIGDSDFVEFFKFCVDHNLLEFMVQREWRGSLAIFRVLNSFSFRIERFLDNNARAIVICAKGDSVELSELLDTTDYKFTQDDGASTHRHTIRVDVPTDGKRHKVYKKFNYDV